MVIFAESWIRSPYKDRTLERIPLRFDKVDFSLSHSSELCAVSPGIWFKHFGFPPPEK